MINHRDKQIEKQRRPAPLHLRLQRPAPLERGPAADDEREVVGAQLGVRGGRVRVGVAGRGEDGAALDARGEALFLEGEALEVREGVVVGGALGNHVSKLRRVRRGYGYGADVRRWLCLSARARRYRYCGLCSRLAHCRRCPRRLVASLLASCRR